MKTFVEKFYGINGATIERRTHYCDADEVEVIISGTSEEVKNPRTADILYDMDNAAVYLYSERSKKWKQQ